MNTENDINTITEQVIGCAYRISNILGIGFLEKVYENALCVELRQSNISFIQQHPVKVYYQKTCVGCYVADLLVAGQVIVELKAVKSLNSSHFAQCMNYLKSTDLKVCLLINFGTPKIEIRRIVN